MEIYIEEALFQKLNRITGKVVEDEYMIFKGTPKSLYKGIILFDDDYYIFVKKLNGIKIDNTPEEA